MISPVAIAFGLLFLCGSAYYAVSYNSTFKSLLVFVYNCFLKPISKDASTQKTQIESFYKNQASIYDSTRKRLLKGRELVLELSSSHLKNEKNPVWIDVSLFTTFGITFLGF